MRWKLRGLRDERGILDEPCKLVEEAVSGKSSTCLETSYKWRKQVKGGAGVSSFRKWGL